MKYVFLFLVGLLSFSALAATPEEENGLIGFVFNSLDYMNEFFHHAPSVMERLFAYIIEYSVMISLKMKLESLQFSYGVATAVLQNLSFNSLINDAFSQLPQSQREIIGAYGIGAGIVRIIEAAMTRFVMDFMGV